MLAGSECYGGVRVPGGVRARVTAAVVRSVVGCCGGCEVGWPARRRWRSARAVVARAVSLVAAYRRALVPRAGDAAAVWLARRGRGDATG